MCAKVCKGGPRVESGKDKKINASQKKTFHPPSAPHFWRGVYVG